jgi:hypothetical protein
VVLPALAHDVLLELAHTSDLARLRADTTERFAELTRIVRDLEASAAAQERRHRRSLRLLVANAIALLLVVGLGGWWMLSLRRDLSEATAQLAQAERQSADAAAAASASLAAVKADAAGAAERARQARTSVDNVAAILGAPDLVRYAVPAAGDSRASAQLLWSRTRGVVLSALGLAPLPAGASYHLWLLADTGAVSAGQVVADPAGRATLVLGTAPRVPAPVTGGAITIEAEPAASVPSGQVVARTRPPAPVAEP